MEAKMSTKLLNGRTLGITLALLFFIAVCATAAETRLATNLADGGEAVIIFAGSPLRTMTEIPFSIQLGESTGEVVKDAELALDLTMPAMPMPANNPKAVWQDNAYRGTAIFTMAGAWQVNVEIHRPGVDPEKIVFDIEMVVMK